MPRLIRLDTGNNIGNISDAQLKFLIEQLDEEHEEDEEYYIDREAIEVMSDNGGDPDLLAMLEKAIGDDDQLTIAWE